MVKDAGQYRTFDRATWAAMGPANGTDITAAEIDRVRSLNDKLSIDDVRDVYMPLVRYLRLRRDNYLQTEQAKAGFLGTSERVAPFIIGISGSVAVGKSTSARLLQLLMNRVMPDLKTQMLTTDGFLYPNAELERRGIMARKGFPESYDMHALLQFLMDIKLGQPAKAPLYSHEEYDVVPGRFTTVDQQDIVIVEGINVLQTGGDEPIFYSDLFDLSLYVDAAPTDIARWYEERFYKLLSLAKDDPNDYYYDYANGDPQTAADLCRWAWDEVNLPNLEEYILPTRARADVILHKRADHTIDTVAVRRF